MSAMPEGMANGPSKTEQSEKGAQIWERPWTLEEMRQNSASWSLAADSGVNKKCHCLSYFLTYSEKCNSCICLSSVSLYFTLVEWK